VSDDRRDDEIDVRQADEPPAVAELTPPSSEGEGEAPEVESAGGTPEVEGEGGTPEVEGEGPAPGVERAGWVDDAREYGRVAGDLLRDHAGAIALTLTLAGTAIWAVVFSVLGVRHHRNFATWAFDMAIYDQAFWLVGQGGETFSTVRGLDVWGHHLNLIAYAFAPLYRWFDAGPEFLYVVQNVTLALGALPVYLIARRRFGQTRTALTDSSERAPASGGQATASAATERSNWYAPYIGLGFAVAYLLYAPTQFIAWINFHPEAMVITPFLFAWYFSMLRRWWWFFAFLLVALSMREDTALAVIMLGLVLVVVNRHSATRRRDMQMALATVALGVGWYLIATQVIIRHFNAGEPPFYLSFFFQQYGGSFSGIVRNSLRHPNWVVRDAVQPDRIRFYRDLTLPLGGLPLASPLHLLMAAPQLLASVIGGSPYARQILYQYTSVMIAPILIASIEGARNVWDRFRVVRKWIVPWLLVFAYATNVAWSPSPFGDRYGVWARSNPRAEAMQEAIDVVPDDAAVTSTYNFGPHLSRRRLSFDWPNPFWHAYWGNEAPGIPDCDRFPSASVVDYLVLDRTLFANTADPIVAAQASFIDHLVSSGEFDVVFDSDGVLVAERARPGPDGEPLPPNCPTDLYQTLQLYGVEIPEVATAPASTVPSATTSPAPQDDPATGVDVSTTSSTAVG
jgi:uncharacterized membrane protein